MTIKLPQKTLLDKLLALFGKKRAVIVPSTNGEKITSSFSYSQLRKESFFKALLRPSGKTLPKGLFYPEDLSRRLIP